MEAENHPIEKENHLKPSILRLKMLIFMGVREV